ncbi:hypothetical protein FVE85_5958 [Porphyridium purpureum]|uniref:Uncharacterized protein n=1 Tax=Porphyridium purpureum TaxID=35688 RepID=A0A5J4Z6B1_PORPP|nr:hypothetical protein FVE85_5958 [Porphyridium purpureum]|eukprot:POR6249..scf295_1
MRASIVGILVLLCAVCVSCVHAAAYIKFDGVDGESTSSDDPHKEWIPILSSSLTSVQGPFRLSFLASAKTMRLVQHLVARERLTEVVIEFVQDDETPQNKSDNCALPYLRYELKDVLISSYSVSGAASGVPTEEVAFNYAVVQGTFYEVDSDCTSSRPAQAFSAMNQ